MYSIGDIFYIDKDYGKRADFCNDNGLIIVEIEPDEKGRRFQIQEVPPPSEEDFLVELRYRRDVECFSIINRGQLWYDTLTEEQRQDLVRWYFAWLDVTETKIIPEKLIWLK